MGTSPLLGPVCFLAPGATVWRVLSLKAQPPWKSPGVSSRGDPIHGLLRLTWVYKKNRTICITGGFTKHFEDDLVIGVDTD